MQLEFKAIAHFLIAPVYLLGSLLLFSCYPTPLGESGDESVDSSELTLGTELTEEIDRLVAASLRHNGPGVAVLIIDRGAIFQKGYGLGQVVEQRPITPDTVFDLASVSKQMTALGILRLMEAGKLELEDAVMEHLPDFEDPDPDNPIVIRDLLNHTSGLADYTGEAWQETDEAFARLTIEDHLQWLNQQEIESDRGVEFEYNNSGYALLALIIERISGQSFGAFMAEQIFTPLGMNNTVVFGDLDQQIPNRAEGYAVSPQGDVEPSSFPSVIAGDGNIFSSIADLVRYDQGLRNGDLVTPATLKLAFTPGTLDDGESFPYGLGWEISPDYVEHRGSWYGTSTFYRHYTQVPVTIIVLANDENYPVDKLVDDLARLLRD
ncbi:beta-lactamase family protein [Spirulina subsalsa FACHB-351]|uniref:Beta-lactamase family protein n=1 Tax=Spirulina subsalsa FACHB-351 TaxID=234711 RepID=A0ABT3L2Q4_9CYAN|nr:serine hydrolase domain-containing protein [Spirulina subsalsa]MCW6035791.1 beta-lactamase family protein [Spirulina subsalsa FACHB-351]